MGLRVDSRLRRMCSAAVFTLLALALSYLEFLLPLTAVPLPGVKPGLANLAVMAAFVYLGPLPAAAVSGVRVVLSALLFGSPVSFAFSASGAVLSYLMLWLLYRFARDKISFIGISVACAAAHSLGQICAAGIVFSHLSVFRYLPLLLVASAVFGCVTGMLMNLLIPPLTRALEKGGVRLK